MEYRRTIERKFTPGADPALSIANRRGSLQVRGEERSDIAFTATLRVHADNDQAADELFDAVELPISEHEGTIEIGPPELAGSEDEDGGFPGVGSWFGSRRDPVKIDMVAAVPRACSVRTRNRAGSTEVAGIHAVVAVESRAGRVNIREIDGEVTAKARAGALHLTSMRGNVHAETRAGSIEAERIAGDAALSTRAGSVRLREVEGDVTVSTRTGGIELENVDGEVRVSGKNGGVRYRGRVAHPVDIAVGTGAIQLGVTPDSSFFLDAKSDLGAVRSDLDVDATREADDYAPTVRLRTNQGAIRVVPA
jgi:hypothetical protein